MIKIFNYTNKQGQSSIKVVAVTFEDARYIGGVSLGSIMWHGAHDLKQVLRDYIGYKVADHMPTRAARNAAGELEGFSRYNDSYKMFFKDKMKAIGILACKSDTIDYVAKLIEPIKNLDKAEEQKATPAMHEAIGPQDSMFDYFDAANNRVFSKWADSELSSDDYTIAFSTGFRHEEMPFVAEDFDSQKDFEYAESAHELGAKAAAFETWDEFADYLDKENQ